MESDKIVKVDGRALNEKEDWFSWENLKKSVAYPMDNLIRMLERARSISVNDLMNFKKPVTVSLTKEGYYLSVKEDVK